ncbi:hypothetical protein ES702_04370 [subsurface metagenome]
MHCSGVFSILTWLWYDDGVDCSVSSLLSVQDLVTSLEISVFSRFSCPPDLVFLQHRLLSRLIVSTVLLHSPLYQNHPPVSNHNPTCLELGGKACTLRRPNFLTPNSVQSMSQYCDSHCPQLPFHQPAHQVQSHRQSFPDQQLAV